MGPDKLYQGFIQDFKLGGGGGGASLVASRYTFKCLPILRVGSNSKSQDDFTDQSVESDELNSNHTPPPPPYETLYISDPWTVLFRAY